MRANRKLILEAQEILKQLKVANNIELDNLKQSKAMVLVNEAMKEIGKCLSQEPSIIMPNGIDAFIEAIRHELEGMEFGEDAIQVFNIYYELSKEGLGEPNYDE